MNKKILRYEIIGFIVVSILGVLLHFAYDWSGHNRIVGLFCPVNESVFEHLKLIFFPYSIYGAIESIWLKQDKFNVSFAKLAGVLSGIYAIISIYYIIYGAFGNTPDWVNIASFFIGVFVSFVISYKIIISSKGSGFINGLSVGLLIIIAISFIFFTLYPIKIPFFMSPDTLTYGINETKKASQIITSVKSFVIYNYFSQ